MMLASFFAFLLRFALSLRYRLEVRGLENLSKDTLKRPGGTLFLPNHPAEIDPILLEVILWRKFQPRPLVVEHFYHLKGFKVFLDWVKALPLPNFDVFANKWRKKRVDAQFQAIAEELKKGGNFLIYPAGRLKLTGLEVIGGASFAHSLLDTCPESNVVLVRTTGLWGSKFSRALTGSSPDFGKVFRESLWILLKNALFFTPRRLVQVEFVPEPADLPRGKDRLTFNKYLENWYNRYPDPGPESPTLVSYAFWKEEKPTLFIPVQVNGSVEEKKVPEKILNEVLVQLKELTGRPIEHIERKNHLSMDLGLDSLDIAEVYIFLEDRYGVSQLAPGDLQTVEDCLQFAAGLKKGNGNGVPRESIQRSWPEEKSRPRVMPPSGKTLQEALLHAIYRMKGAAACIDATSGALSYRKLLLAAFLLAKQVGSLPGNYVGVLLPSSVGGYLAILSVLLAGKVPVMLNWTVGLRALDHAADLTQLQGVITSSKFLDRLPDGDLGKIEEKLLLLEEMKEKITWKEKLEALWFLLLSPKKQLQKLGLDRLSENDQGVILFTSGTETLPKGVPLTHANLLSNQRAALEVAQFRAEDSIYACLPPFHSFGFNVTGLLPILSGLKVCYAPDPTDAHGLVREIAHLKPSIFVCAPSFIKGIFHVAKPEELSSLRLIVSGAEKTPQDLFDYVHAHLPHAELLEGYGITECSPVVSVDRPGKPHAGVGKAAPGVDLMMIDMESLTPLPEGKEGEICIAGPGVFGGYLGIQKDPFLELNGKRWYRSGDRGYLDSRGNLFLSGRLKRFIKIGGEMVSLGGLEDELLRIAHEKKWITGSEEGPPLAVCSIEKGKAQIILFTTFKIGLEEVNAALKECGYGRIVKIAEVRVLEQIPLTGTGKTHYRSLEES
ncbi:MAG: AMP-binding protein [Verrucomicrobia bacterium]|nr:AMP-binding protein [Verrucomicrobiota bacterium]